MPYAETQTPNHPEQVAPVEYFHRKRGEVVTNPAGVRKVMLAGLQTLTSTSLVIEASASRLFSEPEQLYGRSTTEWCDFDNYTIPVLPHGHTAAFASYAELPELLWE